MGSTISPKLANALLVYFEKNWLQSGLPDFKPHYYCWYVDFILVLFTSPEHLEAFQNFQVVDMLACNSQLKNEKENRMSFLDAQIIR